MLWHNVVSIVCHDVPCIQSTRFHNHRCCPVPHLSFLDQWSRYKQIVSFSVCTLSTVISKPGIGKCVHLYYSSNLITCSRYQCTSVLSLQLPWDIWQEPSLSLSQNHHVLQKQAFHFGSFLFGWCLAVLSRGKNWWESRAFPFWSLQSEIWAPKAY